MPFARDCTDALGLAYPSCRNRIRHLAVGQKTSQLLRFQLTDGHGDPIDLTQVGLFGDGSSSSCSLSSWSSSSSSSSAAAPRHGVEIIVKAMNNSVEPYWAEPAVVRTREDAAAGWVELQVTPAMSGCPGLWLAMAIIWDCGVQRRHVPLFYEVTPNLREYVPSGGPPGMWEIRMVMRDLCPEGNFLLDAVDYHDDELFLAARHCVDYWNERPPPVGFFTTNDFPFRFNWIEGVIGRLLQTGSVWLRRNDLDYTAAGLSIADTKKWPDYAKMGQERWGVWTDFVKHKKIEINLDGAYGSLGGYRHAPYR